MSCLLHLLNLCEAGVHSIAVVWSWRLQHLLPGQHADVSHQSCFPQLAFVENVVSFGAGHQKDVLKPHTVPVEGAWLKRSHSLLDSQTPLPLHQDAFQPVIEISQDGV